MDPRHVDVERIVREVLARLGHGNGVRAGALATAAAGVGTASGERAQAAGENGVAATNAPSEQRSAAGSPRVLRLDARLVTLAELHDRLDGIPLDDIETLEVPARAVVTPAVRDALRDRGIALAWRVPGNEPRRDVTLCIAVAETAYPATGVRVALAAQGVKVSDLPPGTLADVVERLPDRVARDGALAVVLTERTAAAVCLANRHHSIRAASAASVGEVHEAGRQIDPNVLVVDPRGTTVHALRRLAAAFVACAGGGGGGDEQRAPWTTGRT